MIVSAKELIDRVLEGTIPFTQLKVVNLVNKYYPMRDSDEYSLIIYDVLVDVNKGVNPQVAFVKACSRMGWLNNSKLQDRTNLAYLLHKEFGIDVNPNIS